MYRIALSDEAKKRVLRMDSPLRLRITRRLDLLAQNPFDPRLSSPLTERQGLRKSRVGAWRILFSVDGAAGVVYIVTVNTRGQVYQRS